MPLLGEACLSIDEIDDLLYFTRTNDATELNQAITALAHKYRCSSGAVISSGVDLESGNTVLHYCCANGLVDILTNLLAQLSTRSEANGIVSGKQPVMKIVNSSNEQGNTPLHWAAYNGHLEVVKVLVSNGADLWIKNAAGHLAMFEAERAEKSEVVQFLLEAGGETVDRVGSETESADEEAASAANGSANAFTEETGPTG